MTSEALLISRIGTALAGLAMALFLITLLLTMQVENPMHPLAIVCLPALPTLLAASATIIKHRTLTPDATSKLLRLAGIAAGALLVVTTAVVLVLDGSVAPSLLLAVVGAQNAAGLFLAAHYFQTSIRNSRTTAAED
ncbi:MAG: hypothetical protein Q4E03_02725 [Trueperella sp.]|nr:hypothetical protein [Trueperella sp.]